jgi:hypothetical protein
MDQGKKWVRHRLVTTAIQAHAVIWCNRLSRLQKKLQSMSRVSSTSTTLEQQPGNHNLSSKTEVLQGPGSPGDFLGTNSSTLAWSTLATYS